MEATHFIEQYYITFTSEIFTSKVFSIEHLPEYLKFIETQDPALVTIAIFKIKFKS